MSIKYRTSAGTSASDFTDLVVKVGDTLPIGAIIGFDTTGTIPNGWEYYAENQIKKISPTTPANGNIENQYGTSQTNAYSEAYINSAIPTKTSDLTNDSNFATTDVATTSSDGLMSAFDKLMLDNAILSSNSITYSTNWNDARDTGYRLYNAWTGSGGSNRPTDTKCMGCVLVITDASGTTTTQIFFPFSSTLTPMYRWYNGNWESWKSF